MWAVADIVDGCRDTYVDPKPEWRKRKEDYLAHLRDPKRSASIRFVSVADKLHNATTTQNDYRRLGDAWWGASMADKRAHCGTTVPSLMPSAPAAIQI
jgi:hypothetical protein